MKSEEEQKKEALEYLYSKRMALRAEYLGTNALLVKKRKTAGGRLLEMLRCRGR